MAALTVPRAHLQPIVTVALGTGMRLGEQLRMKRHQVDFLRNIVTARHTKNGRPRDIPMNDDVDKRLLISVGTNGLTITSALVRKPVHAFGR